MIKTFAMAGDTSAALDVYNRLWRLLEHEYDIEPSEQTIELIAAVKLGTLTAESDNGNDRSKTADARVPLKARHLSDQAAPGSTAAFSQKTERLTIVVNRFNTAGITDDQQHIYLGFRAELTAMLVKFREWSVIDATTHPNIENEDIDLRARYDLSGQLNQDGDKVYLVLDLSDPSNSTMVWSDRYEIDLNNYFIAQRKIVHKITFSLNVHISQERLRRWSNVPDVSLDVYDRWLRGQDYFLQWSPAGRVRSAQIFESIITEAPRFARAYSSLVAVHNSNQYVFPGVPRSRQDGEEALRLSRIAIELDPLDSRSQLHHAWAQTFNGEFATAHIGFKLACELNETDPWAAASAAGGFAFCGDSAMAVEWSERALELAIAPVPMVWAYTSVVRYVCGDIEGSLLAASQSQREVLIMQAWKAAALSRLGRTDAARDQAAQLVESLAANWYGENDPTTDAIVDWVIGCFPISEAEVATDFRHHLSLSASIHTSRETKFTG